MNHTLKTFLVIIGTLALGGIVLALGSLTRYIINWLFGVDPVCWIFFAAGIVLALVSSLLAALISRKKSNDN